MGLLYILISSNSSHLLNISLALMLSELSIFTLDFTLRINFEIRLNINIFIVIFIKQYFFLKTYNLKTIFPYVIYFFKIEINKIHFFQRSAKCKHNT